MNFLGRPYCPAKSIQLRYHCLGLLAVRFVVAATGTDADCGRVSSWTIQLDEDAVSVTQLPRSRLAACRAVAERANGAYGRIDI